ncbi:MAG: GLPGLI family protein [Chitinophagaceae bacterium]
MKRQILIAVALVFQFTICHAQQIFIKEVSVDYTKTLSWWPMMKEIEPEWFERSKDRMPKEIISVFNFTGDDTKSVYKRIKEPERKPGMWFQSFADENMIYNDYIANTTITQKPVYEETFLVQDSLLNIKWKITPDTRTIAGFNCHKAIGFLYDTVAVFAFYTDEIAITGGPESIHGLPGLILGVGIPRLHTTWFANRISINGVDMKKVVPATKGKKTNRKEMLKTINNVMKNWDEYGQKMLLAYVI